MEVTVFNMQLHNHPPQLKAVASITIDGNFAVNNIKVIFSDGRLFLSMPSWMDKGGDYHDLAHPTNEKARQLVMETVLREYHKLAGGIKT